MQANDHQVWRCAGRALPLCDAPWIMGILNVTPDSFSDGGRYADPGSAVERGLALWEAGAEIVDIGGESTRPGALPVGPEEEIRRVVPVVRALAAQARGLVSVDTRHALVARQALAAGAHIINDVSAGTQDAAMVPLVAAAGCGYILMHMQGRPATMQDEPVYGNVVGEVCDYLVARVHDCMLNGVSRECLAVDPGIGFGKTVAHNLRLLAGLEVLLETGLPVVAGLSRKRFLGALTGREVQDRLAGSLAGAVYCMLKGVHILRVHDVAESRDALQVVRALRSMENGAA